MRIRVKDTDTNIRLAIPDLLIYSRLTLGLVKKYSGFDLIGEADLKSLRKAVRKFKRRHKSFVLVEVRSNEGEDVTIKL